MKRVAIAVLNGHLLTNTNEAMDSLRSRFMDYIADGQYPGEVQFFRLPRRMEFRRVFESVKGARLDRVCPKCRCGMRYHHVPCFGLKQICAYWEGVDDENQTDEV